MSVIVATGRQFNSIKNHFGPFLKPFLRRFPGQFSILFNLTLGTFRPIFNPIVLPHRRFPVLSESESTCGEVGKQRCFSSFAGKKELTRLKDDNFTLRRENVNLKGQVESLQSQQRQWLEQPRLEQLQGGPTGCYTRNGSIQYTV